MQWRTIFPLVGNDLIRFARNPYFGIITFLYLALFVGIYLALPATVEDHFSLGLYAPELDEALPQDLEVDGLELRWFDTEEELQQAIQGDAVYAGLVIPANLLVELAMGARPSVTAYLPDDAPPETAEMMRVLVQSLFFEMLEQPAPIMTQREVLGPDLAGDPIAPRDRMVPLIVTIILLVATMGQAALIASEIETGAADALMSTPMGIGEFFVAKSIGGILIAFGQVFVVLMIIGALAQQTLIVLILVLLGAMLVIGIGFLMAATGWDTPTLMALGFLIMIPLSAPPFDILFPGTITGWGLLIPTHYLSVALHRASNLGMGWGNVWQEMAILLAFCVVLGIAGVLVLRTKFR